MPEAIQAFEPMASTLGSSGVDLAMRAADDGEAGKPFAANDRVSYARRVLDQGFRAQDTARRGVKRSCPWPKSLSTRYS